MEILEYSPENFEDLKLEWNNLETGEDMTVYQSFNWYRWINSAYQKEKVKNRFREWTYILCKDKNQAVMIAPIQVVKKSVYFKGIGLEKGAYFIGRQGYSDYLNMIYKRFNKQAFDDIKEFLFRRYSVKSFIFENVLESTEFSKYIVEHYHLDNTNKISCAALTLPESFEIYKQSLKKHAKQNIRTAINRQKRDSLDLVHEVVFQVNPELQKTLWGVRAGRLKEKQRKSVSKLTSRIYLQLREWFIVKFNAKMNIFDCKCDQWCFLVRHEEKTVGFFWGLRDVKKNNYYVTLAGVDKEYEWYSPSISHLFQWISELYEAKNDKVNVIDFTVGDERYKTDIGGTVKYIHRLAFTI